MSCTKLASTVPIPTKFSLPGSPLAVATAVILLDQLTKYLVVRTFQLRELASIAKELTAIARRMYSS